MGLAHGRYFPGFSCPGKRRILAGLFPEIAGWQKKGAVEIFSPENLYEYIDGAAENFIGYDFRSWRYRTTPMPKVRP